MTTQQELLAALRGRFGDSQTAIAEALGISLSRLNNYVRDQRTMDDEAVIACCELLGWNTQKYVAKHRAENAKTKRERAFWIRLGSATAFALFALFPAANPALAYSPSAEAELHDRVYIMRS
jgi:transcriptional regulator with XRE-family HTH domain